VVKKLSKEVKKEDYIPRLKKLYFQKVIPEMMKEFQLKNVMEVPRIEKIVINMGVGEAAQDPSYLEQAMEDLALITGQKPAVTKAKKSVSGFKVRKGMAIGCKVTLRGDRMYEFLDRLINIALPRVRDFRGLSRNSFDGQGNYTFGLSEQYVFPEIDLDKSTRTLGMDITIVTNTDDDELALTLLEKFNFPFRRERKGGSKASDAQSAAG
jgi:large subunit ribosomal protein L5